MQSQPTMIPDLCRLPVTLASMVVVQLLLIVYVLSLAALQNFDWSQFALLSLYVQWILLAGLFAVCALRNRFNRMSRTWCVFAILCLMSSITAVVNTLFQWLAMRSQGAAFSIDFAWMFRDILIVVVLSAIALRYSFLQLRWKTEQIASEAARFDALQSRIQPHFLFNTMNSIASLVREQPAQAEEAIEDLSRLLRQQIDIDQKFHDWQHELALCEAYLRIERLRYQDRMTIQWDVEQIPHDLQLPPLVLQPLVENAVRHGIAKLMEPGFIRISGSLVDQKKTSSDVAQVCITIENSVPEGFLPYAGKKHSNPIEGEVTNVEDEKWHSQEQGIALANVRSRIISLFRDRDSGQERASVDFELRSRTCIVKLTIPYSITSETR